MACKLPNRFFPVQKAPALISNAMKGKFALITGGGTGIGKKIAEVFASLGASVSISGRRLDVLEKTAGEISQKTNAQIFPLKMDVRKPEEVAICIDKFESKFAVLPNILVNNAAGNFIMASERLSQNAINSVLNIVLYGTINCSLEIGRRIISRPVESSSGCAVLSISTPYARNGAPFVLPSAVAKAGVENLTRSLCTEWAKYGMRFNVIAPGPVLTEGSFKRLTIMPYEEAKAASAKTIPLGRCGEPEEIANLAAFICSDFGSWLNGAIIDMDGGQQFLNHGSSFGSLLHSKTPDDWKEIEKLVKGRTGK